MVEALGWRIAPPLGHALYCTCVRVSSVPPTRRRDWGTGLWRGRVCRRACVFMRACGGRSVDQEAPVLMTTAPDNRGSTAPKG